METCIEELGLFTMDSFGLVYPLIPGYKSGLGFGLICGLGPGLGGTLI